MAMRRRVVEAAAKVGALPEDESTGFARDCPALVEFLTCDTWPEGGDARQRGSLLVFFQDGMMKVRLVDNDADQVAFWSGPTLAEALRRVEEDLATGSGDWRAQKPFGARKR